MPPAALVVSPAALTDRDKLDALLEESRERIAFGMTEHPIHHAQCVVLPVLNDDGVRELVRRRMEGEN